MFKTQIKNSYGTFVNIARALILQNHLDIDHFDFSLKQLSLVFGGNISYHNFLTASF